jgi:dTDP-4-amino-4,6-dideoxy-D-galactose acyltransferase
MSIASATVAAPTIERLEWESEHFGLSAARLIDCDLDHTALDKSLAVARAKRIDLLVWAAGEGMRPSADLLAKYHGTLVDRKATFARSLEEITDSDVIRQLADFDVGPYAESAASEELIELAIAAGAHSRFRVDSRLPHEKFAAMYRIWIERSVKKELADVVVVAQRKRLGLPGCTLGGMITVSTSDRVASIGLVAVAESLRGIGVGSCLIAAAHRWLRKRDAIDVQVITQLDNVAACRLYERAGYRLCRLQHFYHFWPLALS